MGLREFLLGASFLLIFVLQLSRAAPQKRQTCAPCPGGQQVQDLATCECSCPGPVPDCTFLSPNYTFNDIACACQCRNVPKCTNREVFNFVLCTCDCPLGEDSCPGKQFFDGAACDCVCPPEIDRACRPGYIFHPELCVCFDPKEGPPSTGDIDSLDEVSCPIPPPPPPYPPPPAPVQDDCTLTCNERQQLDPDACECVCLSVVRAPCPSQDTTGTKSKSTKKKKKSHSSSSGSRSKRSHTRSMEDECDFEDDSTSTKTTKTKTGTKKTKSSGTKKTKSSGTKTDTGTDPEVLTECPSGQSLDTQTCQCYYP